MRKGKKKQQEVHEIEEIDLDGFGDSFKFEGPRFVGDEDAPISLNRRIARYLSRYKWYYPHRDNSELCLDQAWQYFETVTLPRYLTDELAQRTDGFERAARGEYVRETALYPLWSTPMDEMADFGIGVGLYFATIRTLTFVMLIAGCLNIYSQYYYAYDYDPNSKGDGIVEFILRGSAACGNKTLVHCPNCNKTNWDDKMYEEFESKGITYFRKNMCSEVSFNHGVVSLATACFALFAVIGLGKFSGLIETRFDENEQSAQDYSIQVKNPPPDITDPAKYKSFFEAITGEHVTFVTIALDNTELLQLLMKRRVCIRNLFDISRDEDDDERTPAARINSYTFDMVGKDLLRQPNYRVSFSEKDVKKMVGMKAVRKKMIMKRVIEYEKQIRALYKKQYNVCKVFITFETELGQRLALDILNTARYDHEFKTDDSARAIELREDLKFEGQELLYVSEPSEPSAIRYEDLGVATKIRIRWFFTTTFTVAGCIVSFIFLVRYIQGWQERYAPIAVSVLNVLVPKICVLLNNLEAHNFEGSYEAVLYAKISLLKWVNTAIMFTVLTPFTRTLNLGDEGLLNSVILLLVSETFTSPILKILDPVSNFKKHILAPRQTNQASMNLNFKGTPYYLAERYTDITKIFFVTCFYSVLLPVGFFFGALSLFILYWTDKFLFLRTYAAAPNLGSQIPGLSRKYFFTSVIALFVMSAFWWSGFPFDNLCFIDGSDNNDVCDVAEEKGYECSPGKYKYCNQDLLRNFVAKTMVTGKGSWFNNDQKLIVQIFSWTVLVSLLIAFYFLVGSRIQEFFIQKKKSTYNPHSTKDQFLNFSNIPEIYAYVPEIYTGSLFQYPFIACDINDIDDEAIYWIDANNDRSYWNVIYDVPNTDENSLNKENNDDHSAFSKIAHYPPDWAQ